MSDSGVPRFRHVVVVANARIPGERAQSIQTVRTAAAFARAGCDVELLYARRRVRRALAGAGGDPLAYYGVTEPVRLRSVPVIDWIERVPRSLQFWPARLEELTFGRNAARACAETKGALVHCREIEVGVRLAARGDVAFLFEAHSIPRGRLRRGWMAGALHGALGVAAITAGLADDLAEEFGIERAAILVAPDAYEARAFEALPPRAEAKRRVGAPEGVLVVYAGHLFPWKGASTLVEAARRAPELRVRLVGGLPEDVERTREQARGLANVEVLGHRAPTEIPLHLAAADVVVVPNSAREAISARHTSPLKVFEAMAAGRAIVASDLPSLREVLTHGRNARLVAPDDPSALAAALRELARDESERDRLGAGARADSARYTFDARARSLLDLAERSAG